ncbi:hypothetical protein BDQ12DRAFT_290731 [Crucibulum laeve]|uniref:Zinc-ribbon 15 domain-containing protein n=1 Tax=Crucibulum laeve TaxID=68775 RepID=A0A5C3MCU4_9AGAR|nr:hypothetical protein BDQ12DRAFT_290731 [Crucibulum laeve]
MDFFCLPIICGCQTQIAPEGDQNPRICPRCHNAAVVSAKSREWFEFCFVPMVPMSSKQIWTCAICNWNVPLQSGWEPQQAGGGQLAAGYYPPGGWQQPGYQPGPQPVFQPGPQQQGYHPGPQSNYQQSPAAHY